MAWTFRKKIKIAPGVSLNLSKSGVSTSIGPKGAKVSFGSKGTYLHTGIPGTGLYNRQKIGAAPTSNEQSNTLTTSYPTKSLSSNDSFGVDLDMDRTGHITFLFTDDLGHPITDDDIIQKLIRKTKATYQYKEHLAELQKMTYEKVNSDTEAFTDLHKKTPRLKIDSEVTYALSHLTQKHYTPILFEEEVPNKDIIQRRLCLEANEKFKSLFWWRNKPARKEYVEKNTPIVYQKELKEWERKRDVFNARQAETKRIKDEEFLREYMDEKHSLESFFSRNEEEVINALRTESDKISKEVPGNFALTYNIDLEYGILYVLLDLPEIEEIPKDKAVYLPSGKISFKQKTIKEVQLDYVRCICGLAFFVAGRLFNVNSAIQYIQISGFTQRINKATGETGDDYVYSVFFDREAFSLLNVKAIEPFEAIQRFPCRVKASVTGVLSTITPFTKLGDSNHERGKIPQR